MPEQLPARIYVCPECRYQTEYRWVLKNHLRDMHRYRVRDAANEAAASEYWLNPRYVRREDLFRNTYQDE